MEAICAVEEAELGDDNEARPTSGPLAALHAKTDRQLSEYVRNKLNQAVSLACRGEQARRAGRRVAAKELQRRWEETIAEVRRLLPLVRKGDNSLLGTKNAKPSRLRRDRQ
ncbi:MAG: hypothetical protein ACLQKA_11625 [Bryobacteraceae bacterium]